jgi:hypothetical protein
MIFSRDLRDASRARVTSDQRRSIVVLATSRAIDQVRGSSFNGASTRSTSRPASRKETSQRRRGLPVLGRDLSDETFLADLFSTVADAANVARNMPVLGAEQCFLLTVSHRSSTQPLSDWEISRRRRSAASRLRCKKENHDELHARTTRRRHLRCHFRRWYCCWLWSFGAERAGKELGHQSCATGPHEAGARRAHFRSRCVSRVGQSKLQGAERGPTRDDLRRSKALKPNSYPTRRDRCLTG